MRKQLLLLECTQPYGLIMVPSDTINVLVNGLEIHWILLLGNLLGHLLLLRLTLCLTLVGAIVEIKHSVCFFGSLCRCENAIFGDNFVYKI